MWCFPLINHYNGYHYNHIKWALYTHFINEATDSERLIALNVTLLLLVAYPILILPFFFSQSPDIFQAGIPTKRVYFLARCGQMTEFWPAWNRWVALAERLLKKVKGCASFCLLPFTFFSLRMWVWWQQLKQPSCDTGDESQVYMRVVKQRGLCPVTLLSHHTRLHWPSPDHLQTNSRGYLESTDLIIMDIVIQLRVLEMALDIFKT